MTTDIRLTGFTWIAAALCAPLMMSSPTSADPPDAAPIAADTETAPAHPLDIQLVAAEVELAKADLAYVESADKRMPGVYSPLLIEELRVRVETMESALRELRQGGGRITEAYGVRAEGDLAIARAELEHAREIYRRLPEEQYRLDGERKRRKVEAAECWVELATSPHFIASPTDQIFWRLTHIQKDLMQLRIEVKK